MSISSELQAVFSFQGNRLCQKREIARSLPSRGDMLDLLYKMNTKWARKVL